VRLISSFLPCWSRVGSLDVAMTFDYQSRVDSLFIAWRFSWRI
jgi:hypothetical protein